MELENIVANTVYLKAREGKLVHLRRSEDVLDFSIFRIFS